MKRGSLFLAFAVVAMTAVPARPVYGQSAPQLPDNLPSCGSYKSVMLPDVEDVGAKLIALAQAMPTDKFTWRPSGGNDFPTVSELYLIAASQYYHRPREWGLPRAAGYEYEGNDATGKRSLPDLDKSTIDKAQVIHELVDAEGYFKGIVKTLTDADMQKPIHTLGEDTTPCGALFVMAGDMHEYLARAMDYARMNGVVLPWMDERQKLQRHRGERTPPNQ